MSDTHNDQSASGFHAESLDIPALMDALHTTRDGLTTAEAAGRLGRYGLNEITEPKAHPVLASFGLVGSYEHVFTFTANGAGGSSKGSASHWMALLVGRIPLGHKARGGTLQIETGYQELDWQHESEQDTRIPDVDYQAIDVGLQWDRELGAKWIKGALRVAYLGVFDAGKITGPQQYGSGNGWGVEAQASLTAWPVRWVWFKLEARYDAMGMSFAHSGTRFASSSLDQWTAGLLEVGFAL